MSDQTLEQRIAYLLDHDIPISSVVAFPPSVYRIPFMKSELDEFVIIWLHLRKDAISKLCLATIVLSAIGICAEVRLSESIKGIEIVPCVVGANGQSDRIFRLSVHGYAIRGALQLTPESLFRARPIEGVTCGWYWDRDLIS